MTLRELVLTVLLSTALVLFGGCGEEQVPPDTDTTTIGAILPLSGDGAKYGQAARRGIEIGLEQGADSLLSVRYEDDKGTTKGAVSAFRNLNTGTRVSAVLGPMYSSTALAVAPIAERERVVVLSPSASSPKLTNAGEFFFRNWPSDSLEGGKIARYAYQELDLRHISILSLNLAYGRGLTSVFNNVFKSLGGNITKVSYYDKGASDFRTQLAKIENTNPDAIYLPGQYSEIGLILRQAQEMGINNVKFLSCVGFDNPKVLEIAGQAANGVTFARPYYSVELDRQVTENFVSSFRDKYSQDPGVWAAHAYDAVRIIAEAVKKKGSEPEQIRNGLNEIRSFPGVTGTTSFDKKGDVNKPIFIMKVSDSSFKRLTTK